MATALSGSQPFDGLFDLSAPGHGRDVNWTFVEPNLNDSVRRLVKHMDSVLTTAVEPGWVFLTTIENDAEAGRFPEVLLKFFAGESQPAPARYFVAPMGLGTLEAAPAVGRLTFETRPGQLIRVLAYNDGFCWGANLSVGGVQVRESDVSRTLTLNPFARSDAAELQSMTRVAWAASRDLDELGVTVAVASDTHELLQKLRLC